jgi:uncharacterized protein
MSPPGWYQTGAGETRWWDGQQWSAPVAARSDHGWAVVAHLGVFFFSVVTPLLVRYVPGNPSDFLKRHSVEALNFQLTVLLAYTVLGIIAVPVVLGSLGDFLDAPQGQFPFPWPWMVLWLLYMVMWVPVAIFAIMGAVRAGGDREWRYPICIRWIKQP